MAITRAQQVRQMLEDGGMLVSPSTTVNVQVIEVLEHKRFKEEHQKQAPLMHRERTIHQKTEEIHQLDLVNFHQDLILLQIDLKNQTEHLNHQEQKKKYNSLLMRL